VNGINVEWEKSGEVAEMIRAGGRELELLVVDEVSDRLFRQRNVTLTTEQPFVDVIVCPDEMTTDASGPCAAHCLS